MVSTDGCTAMDIEDIQKFGPWLRKLTQDYEQKLCELQNYIATAKKTAEKEAGISLPEAQISLHDVSPHLDDVLSAAVRQNVAVKRYELRLHMAIERL